VNPTSESPTVPSVRATEDQAAEVFSVVSSERVFDGKVASLRIDEVVMPGGGTAKREVVEHGGAVAIVALDSAGPIDQAAGFEVVDHLSYGAFPPYFYLFCGAAFVARRGRGLNLQRAVLPYFAGQVLCAPALPILKRMNFAMQTVVCK